LVFSSQYDSHKGVVVFVRVVDGTLPFDTHSTIYFLASNASVAPIEIGFFLPQMVKSKGLATGEVGYIATGLKDVRFAKVGDTITVVSDKLSVVSVKNRSNPQPTTHNLQPLPGYKEPKPMVFLSLFPLSADEFASAREVLEKLRLSDSAFTFRPISSAALGNGFHCGFLGLLHAEIVQERLSREFGLDMIATAPSVEYHITRAVSHQPSAIRQSGSCKLKAESYVSIQSAAEFPDPTYIEEVCEPIMTVTIYTPKTYIGAVMQLSQEKRGEYIDLKYFGEQAQFTYLIPLSEMIVDFFDRLKSVSEGYASLDYEFRVPSGARLAQAPAERARLLHEAT
jgi:GTP-binding protein LepA